MGSRGSIENKVVDKWHWVSDVSTDRLERYASMLQQSNHRSTTGEARPSRTREMMLVQIASELRDRKK